MKIETHKLQEIEKGIYLVRVESSEYLDEKELKIKIMNCPKGGDKWFLDIIIETK